MDGSQIDILFGVSENGGTPKMDGLWKTLLKWMIWGYPYFLETPIWIDALNGLSGIPMKPSATLTMRGFFLNAPQVQTCDSSERHPGWGSPVFNSPGDEI